MSRLFYSVSILSVLLASSAAVWAGDAKPMPQPLWPDGAPGAKGKEQADIPAVMVYLPPKDKANGAAVVVYPGGGYGALAMDHEGHQIGTWLNSHGIAGIITRYRLGPKYHHPIELGDAQQAIRYTPRFTPRNGASIRVASASSASRREAIWRRRPAPIMTVAKRMPRIPSTA